MPAKRLREAVDIRAFILERRAKAKTAKKKATDRKKRLLKAHEVLKKADEQIDHFRSKFIAHAFKKTKFMEELKLSEKISEVTWDAIVRVARMQSQLSSTYKKIFALESLLTSRKAR